MENSSFILIETEINQQLRKTWLITKQRDYSLTKSIHNIYRHQIISSVVIRKKNTGSFKFMFNPTEDNFLV